MHKGRADLVYMAFIAALLAVAPATLLANVELHTENWPSKADGFDAFSLRVESMETRNLLARKGVTVQTRNASGNVRMLTDSCAGTRGDEGRVFLQGKPSVVAYYLGEAVTVTEVGLLGFNGDARANQDYEVRLANNSGKPGAMPKFEGPPQLTTGETLIGANGGGFHSYFRNSPGGPLVPGKIDWVEFRIWPTYNVKAGQPGKAKTQANSATVVCELEVLGTSDNVITFTPEELARRKALREAPRQPPYEKKTTWQKTMVASREAILRWETELDHLMMPESGVHLSPWHILGPYDADSPEARHIPGQRDLDIGKPVTVKSGKETRSLVWKPVTAVRDGVLQDLVKQAGGKPGQVVFLCRKLENDCEFERNTPFSLGAGFGDGHLRILPGGQTYRPSPGTNAVGPNQLACNLTLKPGTYHVLATLNVADEGTCPFWFMPHPPASGPGAGPPRTRIGRREKLFDSLMRDFKEPVSTLQMNWERADSIWIKFQRGQMSRIDKFLSDWKPGCPDFLVAQYNDAVVQRLAQLEGDLAAAEEGVRPRVAQWLKQAKSASSPRTVVAARARYYAVASVQAALSDANRVLALQLAVQDQAGTFADRYRKAAEYRSRTDALAQQMRAFWDGVLAGKKDTLVAMMALRAKIESEGREILLDNPLLHPDILPGLLLARGGPGFSSNWGGANRLGGEIVALSPVRPDGEIRTVHSGTVSDMDLSFDARKILFSDGHHVQEVNVDGTGHRMISAQTDEHVKHYDVCRLPNGKILFVSTACEQAVPCTGGWYVGNLHVMDNDGSNERRLTYDQDHNWNPCVLNSGRVIYTRWEYTDTPHYFTRLLFSMNPDGTNQGEYYGSNSYWPNAMYWPRPIPGHPSMIVCVVSGHHGVGRIGELLLLDPQRGRHEADGVVQRIPGRGRTVEPVIKDGLVSETWPRFATPYPLAEPETHRGAGKYFLVSCKMTQWSNWGLYLVDVFDNMTLLLDGGYAMPTPLRPRPTPPSVTPKIEPGRKDALVYMVNVYEGGGLKGFPEGSVTALRIGRHQYRYGGNGDTRASSMDGGWDVKHILGTVPVHRDGSAFFRVPANTPLFVQPLDAEGKALQIMRSWFVAMPGEVISCVGCHESQNSVPPADRPPALASRGAPSAIIPWQGAARGYSFDRELQPVLDRRCAGCHDGSPRGDGSRLPDFRAKRLHAGFSGPYSPAYQALHPYVRRAGFEADYHLAFPSEWQADTSQVVQMLKKGHHGVDLSREEWETLYTWIDFNVPYPANWTESHRPPDPEQVARRAKYMKLYGHVNDQDETTMPLPEIAAFIPPRMPAPRPPRSPALEGWPVPPEEAVSRQRNLGHEPLVLDLGEGVSMAFMPIPSGRFVMGDRNGFPDESAEAVVAIGQPFFLAKFEVTNKQFSRFDPSHDGAYIDARGKDRFTRGYPANEPEQPVIRVTWRQAMAFCRWLAERTGYECTLPTEAEWEYACRAGTATPWHFGDMTERMPAVANINDSSLRSWNWGRCESDYSDGQRYSAPVGTYKPNAWGLCDMHGNAAEWTLSDYRPYPDSAEGPAGDSSSTAMKVVRGGSWNDLFRFARSGSRWRYPPYQPVYNVGFRVLCRPKQVAGR